jgi:two-component system nitrogen regulation sensor histidine kinase NtrY
MKWFKTLQSRIFLSMLLLVIFVSALIIVVSIIQYRKQAEDYHLNRLDRKESAVKRDIEYQLDNTTFPIITEKLPFIFKEKIFEMSHVHNLEIGLYDMEGNLLKTSRATFTIDSTLTPLSKNVVQALKKDINHRVMVDRKFENEDYLSIYSYIYDQKFTPIGILNIPYLGKSDFYQKELEDLLMKISLVFITAILFSIILAFYISRVISSPIKKVVEHMKVTRLNKINEKLTIKSGTDELHDLIKAYNGMMEELEENAVKLATSERESAWREMAKQVAHEIKNPLTPMRLTIQSFERKFDPKDPEINLKIKDFSQTLIQQIDTMSAIASAFSDFAKMPTPQKELIDIVQVTSLAVDIFSENYISFHSEKPQIMALFDQTQLIRIITNLVTNSNQALAETKNPKIDIEVKEANDQVIISVSDNGKGIEEENKNMIFEPKFTTKSSGMGLGLAIVKRIVESYKGNISFVSSPNNGTVFTVQFPKK